MKNKKIRGAEVFLLDIDILLALQQFRNGAGGILTDFMSKMTFFGDLTTVLVIMAVIYWCVSKSLGVYLLMGWSGNRLVNGVLKVTACVYRPWIRDARVIPDAAAMAKATGYSFPSGHSMNAATVYGGGVVRKDAPVILRVTLGIVVFFVAFSRPFLGVHTPQDILVGVCAGMLVMWLTYQLTQWSDAHPEKDWLIVCIGLGLALAVALYAGIKPYPADYDADGNLLVDGAKMANDTFKGVGWCAAFLIGWILEKRYIKFSTDIAPMQRLTRLVTGLLSYYAVSLILVPLIKDGIGGPAGTVASCFTQMFYIAFIFPWCVTRLEKPEEPEEPEKTSKTAKTKKKVKTKKARARI